MPIELNLPWIKNFNRRKRAYKLFAFKSQIFRVKKLTENIWTTNDCGALIDGGAYENFWHDMPWQIPINYIDAVDWQNTVITTSFHCHCISEFPLSVEQIFAFAKNCWHFSCEINVSAFNLSNLLLLFSTIYLDFEFWCIRKCICSILERQHCQWNEKNVGKTYGKCSHQKRAHPRITVCRSRQFIKLNIIQCGRGSYTAK